MPCLSSKYHEGIGPLIQVVITSIDQDKRLEAISKMLLETIVLEKTPVLYYTKDSMRWLPAQNE